MKTILLVEDDKNQRLLYQQELSLEGYNIITATNGVEAVHKVCDHLPDLIIMDFLLVKRNNTVDLILSKRKKIPIIINTAYGNYKNTSISWPADAFLVKSSDLTELKNRVKELVQNTEYAV